MADYSFARCPLPDPFDFASFLNDTPPEPEALPVAIKPRPTPKPIKKPKPKPKPPKKAAPRPTPQPARKPFQPKAPPPPPPPRLVLPPPPPPKPKGFHLTERQKEAQEVVAGAATHILLVGGSRSGKTFLLVRNSIYRALKAPNSRHAILRFRFNSVKAAVVLDTFPKVMNLCFPGVKARLDKTDWFAEFENGSQIWFGGLDDKERTEKILGMEFATIYLNEASQIPKGSRDLAVTRLAQQVTQKIEYPDGVREKPLKPRMYYDANPPSKAHWTYALFVDKRDPNTKIPLPHPEDYVYFKINPEDNTENISPDYLDTLRGLSARLQKRFLKGDFADATPNALFHDEDFDTWRVVDKKLPEFVRVVVGVDPSGAGDTDNADNDAIGICVGGLGVDGNAYLLEDCTIKAGPATWARVATQAFDRHEADAIVAEMNYGGAMVKSVIQTARPRTPFRAVKASRGKAVRAEPFSALYEQGKIRHAGDFPELEDELTCFSTSGYLGARSPNRADAWIWVLSELFGGIVSPKGPKRDCVPIPIANKW